MWVAHGLHAPRAFPLHHSVPPSRLARAARQASELAGGTDPEACVAYVDMADAKWSTHSLRRMMDKVIREYCEKHGIPDAARKINARMGWKEAEAAKDMLNLYDENNLRRRIAEGQFTRGI